MMRFTYDEPFYSSFKFGVIENNFTLTDVVRINQKYFKFS